MTTQEREYMGRPEEESTAKPLHPFIDPKDLLYLGIEGLKKEVKELQEWKKKAERETQAVNAAMKSEKALREAIEIEAAANLKALQKSKMILQKQGEALICEHYGPSRYRLLIVARALIATATSPDEQWRVNAVNWFDDFEKEIRGLACEPMEATAENAKDQGVSPEKTAGGERSRSQSKSAKR